MARLDAVVLHRRQAVAVHVARWTCCASSRCSPLARVRMGAAVLAVQKFGRDPAPFEQITAARVDPQRAWAAAPGTTVWGPLLRGEVRRARRRDLDGLAVDEVHAAPPARGRGGARGEARLPAALVGAAARDAAPSAPGRARADRPARDPRRARRRRLRRHLGAPGSFRRGHDPRDVRRRAGPSATTRSSRRCPTTSSLGVAGHLLADGLPRRSCAGIDYYAALCVLLELDRQLSPFYWTNVADPDAAVPRADRAHELRRARALRRPALRLRRQLPAAATTSCCRSALDEVLDRYEPGLRKINPALRPRLDQERVDVPRAGRAADRHRSATATRIPPLQTGVPNLVLANTTQVYPEDRGTNYAVRIGGDAAATLLAAAMTHHATGWSTSATAGLRRHTARGAADQRRLPGRRERLNLIRGFALAAFLTAADYGLFGIVFVTLIVLLFFKQVGIGDKYVQQDEADQELAFQKAFTLEVIVCAVGTVAGARHRTAHRAGLGRRPAAARHRSPSRSSCPAWALQMPILVLYRQMRYGRQAALQSIEPVVTTVVSLALAIAGAGYWALIGGMLAGAWAAAAVAVDHLALPAAAALRARHRAQLLDASRGRCSSTPRAASTVIALRAHRRPRPPRARRRRRDHAVREHLRLHRALDALMTQTLYPAICAAADRVEVLHESFVKSNRHRADVGDAVRLRPDPVRRRPRRLRARPRAVVGRGRAAADLRRSPPRSASPASTGAPTTGRAARRGRSPWRAWARTVGFMVTALPLLFLFDLAGYAIGLACQVLVALVLPRLLPRPPVRGLLVHRAHLPGACCPSPRPRRSSLPCGW